MAGYNYVIVEQLFKRENRLEKVLLRVFSVLGCIVLPYIANFLMYNFVSPNYSYLVSGILLGVCIVATIKLFQHTAQEFEYEFYNGEMTITKIFHKATRKKYFAFSCKDVQLFARLDGEHAAEVGGDFTKILPAVASERAPGQWFAVVEKSAAERYLVLLQPNEKMLAAFRQYLTRRKMPEA